MSNKKVLQVIECSDDFGQDKIDFKKMKEIMLHEIRQRRIENPSAMQNFTVRVSLEVSSEKTKLF